MSRKNRSQKKNVTDADDTYAKRVSKDFEINNLGKYQDLNVQSDTLLLLDIFNNFPNMYIGICGLNNAHFF